MRNETRFAPCSIKNKIKREEISGKQKKAKNQVKSEKRKARAKLESQNPLGKKKRLAENVPRTLDNTREYDPAILTADPSTSTNHDPSSPSATAAAALQNDCADDIANDPFASYFTSAGDPLLPSKVLITTSPLASKGTCEFCDELVGIFPGAEFIRRKKHKGFELGKIAGWAAGREYRHLIVVNEDVKKPNAVTLVHLPDGPTAYFRLSSIELTRKIFGHARSTPHNPELILNNFVTRLGHAVGRMFQTLFPPMPEFQGRQVVTLHNQRDFLFFRRHRYAFRSPEKVALQEIGPRFTLKLKWMKRGIPAMSNFGEAPLPESRSNPPPADPGIASLETVSNEQTAKIEIASSKQDEVLWAWKPKLETSRRTFFL